LSSSGRTSGRNGTKTRRKIGKRTTTRNNEPAPVHL
jgi:hypothetical protein